MAPSVTPATSFMTKRLMPKGGVMEADVVQNRDHDAEPDRIQTENLRNGQRKIGPRRIEQQRHGRQRHPRMQKVMTMANRTSIEGDVQRGDAVGE